MPDEISITLSARERATVLAALRFWWARPEWVDDDADYRRLATGDGQWNALDDDEIDLLTSRLAVAEAAP